MAIPSDPKLSEISNEFVSTPSPESLKTFYELVINTNSDGGRQSDFVGLGQPTNVTTQSPSSVSENGATFNGEGRFNTPSGAPNREMRFVYGESNQSIDTWATSWTGYSGSSGNVTVSHSQSVSLSSDTEYHYRIEVKNGFGIRSGSSVTFSTDAPAPSCSSPISVQGFILGSGGDMTGHGVNWEHPDNPDGNLLYDVQRNVNGGGWNTVFGMPTSDTIFTDDVFDDQPYEIQYRVRRRCSSTNFSGYIPTDVLEITDPVSPQ